VQQAQDQVKRARAAIAILFRQVSDFALRHGDGGSEYGTTFRLTRPARVQPAWSQIETAWEEVNIGLEAVLRHLDRLRAAASHTGEGELPDRDGYLLDVDSARKRGAELRDALKSAIASPEDAQVYWITVAPRDGSARLNTAPLQVGPALEGRLFSQKEAVVLTSATLSVERNLRYVKERLHLEDAGELVLGSPFDYPNLVLLYLPTDVPPPNSPGYHAALVNVIAEAARAARGRTMALFTGWAALRSARQRLNEVLAPDGITVLAQGSDGSPQQLIEHFKRTPNTLLLGTGSFWEGVDIAGEALSVLIITRLPFNVPTEPVFAARSERFDDPFNQYGVPQAVLRFKQGFGRLIRRKTDRGVMVILDPRVRSKAYGQAFLDSIPPCTRRAAPTSQLGPEIVRWLSQPHLHTVLQPKDAGR
jgi:DNA polymerase-3 subunit epsilon/ATP-dependent DNA helicase DinG